MLADPVVLWVVWPKFDSWQKCNQWVHYEHSKTSVKLQRFMWCVLLDRNIRFSCVDPIVKRRTLRSQHRSSLSAVRGWCFLRCPIWQWSNPKDASLSTHRQSPRGSVEANRMFLWGSKLRVLHWYRRWVPFWYPVCHGGDKNARCRPGSGNR